MKKLSILLLLVLTIFIVPDTVFAETWEVKNEEIGELITENVGVSTEPPVGPELKDGEITILDVRPPSRSAQHNVYSSGRMTFAGTARYNALFTNNNFTGLSAYKIQIVNNHSSTLTVEIYKNVFPLPTKVQTYTVSPNHTRFAYPSGLDHNALYYLKFSAPSNFSGYVDM